MSVGYYFVHTVMSANYFVIEQLQGIEFLSESDSQKSSFCPTSWLEFWRESSSLLSSASLSFSIEGSIKQLIQVGNFKLTSTLTGESFIGLLFEIEMIGLKYGDMRLMYSVHQGKGLLRVFELTE